MRSVLQNQQLRQLEIVEYLMVKSKVTIKQMSEDLFISEKTIRKDVKAMNNFLYPIEVVTTTRGMFLTLPNNYSTEFIYSCFLEQSIEFSIAEDAFFSEDWTIEELAKKYQVSISTIRRSINRLNEQFNKLGFELLSSPIIYQGEELAITTFIYALIKEKYKMGGSPYKEEEIKLIKEFIIKFYHDNNLVLTNTDLFRLYNSVLTTVTRYKYGHTIDQEIDFYINKKINTSIINDEYFKREMKIHFNIDLTEKSLFQTLWIILNKHHSLTYENLVHSKDSKIFRHNIHKFTELLEEMEREFKIPFASKEQVIVKVFNMSNLSEMEEFILFDPLIQFERELELDYPRYVIVFDQIMERLFPPKRFTKLQLRFMKFQIFTNWIELTEQLRQKHKKPQIAILLTRDFTHSLFIKHKFEYLYKERIELHVLEKEDLQDILKKELDYHILVTDLQGIEPHSDLRVLSIPLFPTRKDFHDFENILYEVKIAMKIKAEETG
ncbi:MAG: helix-turn-helix domain-containing protein [Kurthia sp.]|nr:helix-turn-helix domain-containing protein [Candidatus Kurthia equi]